MTELRNADVLAQRLAEAGCRHAFGMPGGEVLTLVDALAKAGIQFHLVKHENAAGFMAEGVWHRTGAPGIMLATLGPGAMNGVNAVANAHQDRVPLIVLTGAVDAEEAETYTHQVLDHQAVFAPITKATFRLSQGAVATVADKVLAIAEEGRAGPVHIDVPISLAAATAPNAPGPRRVAASPVAPALGTALDEARTWLGAAKRPLMVIGLDALRERAGTELRGFCERFGVPFITTYKAKGLIDERHPLCLGAAGLSPKADAILTPLIDSADLILSVGYDPIEMRTGWRDIWDPARQLVIEIGAETNRHYMHQASLVFVAGVAPTLAVLEDVTPQDQTWAAGEIAAAQTALKAAFPTDEDWGPAAVIDTCRETLPEATLASADSGAHRILLSQMWVTHEPAGLVQSTALCTMGCAIPLAMGTKLAAPHRPVVAFTGDAGFLMVAGELATARELNLPVIIVVFVDASLALIELKQRSRQLANTGVDFGHHDFAAIARAFGGAGHRVQNRAELRAALEDALQADTFTVIAAEIDRGAYDGRI